MSVRVDVPLADSGLPLEHLASYEYFPLTIVHSEDTEPKTKKNGGVSVLKVEARHLVDTIVQLPFTVQVLFSLFRLLHQTVAPSPFHKTRVFREVLGVGNPIHFRLLERSHRRYFGERLLPIIKDHHLLGAVTHL